MFDKLSLLSSLFSLICPSSVFCSLHCLPSVFSRPFSFVISLPQVSLWKQSVLSLALCWCFMALFCSHQSLKEPCNEREEQTVGRMRWWRKLHKGSRNLALLIVYWYTRWCGDKESKGRRNKETFRPLNFLGYIQNELFLWYLLFYTKLQVIKTGRVNDVSRKPCVIRIQHTLRHFLGVFFCSTTARQTECNIIQVFFLKKIVVYS